MSQRQSLLVTLANRTFDGLDLQQLASRLDLPVVRLAGDSVAGIFNSEQITEEPALYVGTGDYNFDAQLAAAIDVVSDNIKASVGFQQCVKHVNGFTCRCGDDFGMKGRVATRDCGVELDNRVVSIPAIDAACDFAAVAKMDMLSVRRGNSVRAEHC